MWECRRCTIPIVAGLVAGALATTAHAQETGTIRGAVIFTASGEPVHGAVVLVVGLSLVALTDADGVFEIPEVPAGTYEVLAQREHFTAARQTVTVRGGTVVVDFTLDLTSIHEELTVTATAGGQTSTFEAFNAISTLDSFDLTTDAQGSLGEALQNLPGVAKRSFGPGASRPIIRGFDGDRVLVMEDGDPNRRSFEPVGGPRRHDRPERPRTGRDRARTGHPALRLERRRRGGQRYHAAREQPGIAGPGHPRPVQRRHRECERSGRHQYQRAACHWPSAGVGGRRHATHQ